MNEIAHLIARPWLMDERMATILYGQYMSGRLSLPLLKANAEQKSAKIYAGMNAQSIGTYARAYKVKHKSGKYVAIMPVFGTLTKRGDMCSYGMRDYMGEIDSLNANEEIAAIVMDMEGPGGTVDGTPEFGMSVKQSRKPTVTFGDCMVASADYWVASQSDFIIGNKNNPTEFGSIGVLCVHEFWGKYIEENIGEIKIIRAPQSKDKARMNPIEALTPDLEKEVTEDLKNNAIAFFSAVKSGRGDRLTQSEKVWGTGKMYKTGEAMELGLIDAEGTLMDAIDKAVELSNSQSDPSTQTKNAKAQGAHKQINKSKSMNMKEVVRKASSLFVKKKAAAKAAAAEPAAAEDATVPMWTAELVFNMDGSGDGATCIHPDSEGNDREFETKVDNNTGNEPPVDPAVTEDDNWSVVASEEAAAPEEEAASEKAEAITTMSKMNASLKKANATIKTLSAELAQLKKERAEEKSSAEADKTVKANKPAGPSTTVVGTQDKQADDKGKKQSAAEKEVDEYAKISSTNLFK